MRYLLVELIDQPLHLPQQRGRFGLTDLTALRAQGYFQLPQPGSQLPGTYLS